MKLRNKPRNQIGRFAAPLLALVLAYCATVGSPRHVATVSVVTAHATLSAVQDMEMQSTCGKPTAPPAPLCVDAPTHRAISAKLATAFTLDGDVARLVRATPVGTPQPAEVVDLIGRISALVRDILALLPHSPRAEQLKANLGAR